MLYIGPQNLILILTASTLRFRLQGLGFRVSGGRDGLGFRDSGFRALRGV